MNFQNIFLQMRSNSLILALFCIGILKSQTYFPPNNSDDWDTISPSSLGWCQQKIDSLNTFLAANNTKAFILLKDGKIVFEEYFNGHSPDDNWYWASAGKTLKAFAVGIAQQENSLQLSDPVSSYLGQGWTSATPTQEDNITIYHQLSMTTGLDDGVDDLNCTQSSCLQYFSDAGTRWAYHNAPYTLLDQVIENATGQTLNQFVTQKIKNPIGMDGLYLPVENNTVFFSTPRSMARFGLLVLNNGQWNGNQIMTDTAYFDEMVNTSQNLNESYGYLWWLNGKDSFMVPQSQWVFNGSMLPAAPDDMISAMGKNGQFINVIPSTNMVWIRMGDAPDDDLITFPLNNEIWTYINELDCDLHIVNEVEHFQKNIKAYPNPTSGDVFIKTPYQSLAYQVFNSLGQIQFEGFYHEALDFSTLENGIYFLKVSHGQQTKIIRISKE